MRWDAWERGLSCASRLERYVKFLFILLTRNLVAYKL